MKTLKKIRVALEVTRTLAAVVAVTVLSYTVFSGTPLLKDKVWEINSPEYADPKISNYDDANVRRISVYTYETYEELNESRDTFREEGEEGWVLGFSTRDESECSIFVVMPESWNDKEKMQTMGHELLHCYGADHKDELV